MIIRVQDLNSFKKVIEKKGTVYKSKKDSCLVEFFNKNNANNANNANDIDGLSNLVGIWPKDFEVISDKDSLLKLLKAACEHNYGGCLKISLVSEDYCSFLQSLMANDFYPENLVISVDYLSVYTNEKLAELVRVLSFARSYPWPKKITLKFVIENSHMKLEGIDALLQKSETENLFIDFAFRFYIPTEDVAERYAALLTAFKKNCFNELLVCYISHLTAESLDTFIEYVFDKIPNNSHLENIIIDDQLDLNILKLLVERKNFPSKLALTVIVKSANISHNEAEFLEGCKYLWKLGTKVGLVKLHVGNRDCWMIKSDLYNWWLNFLEKGERPEIIFEDFIYELNSLLMDDALSKHSAMVSYANIITDDICDICPDFPAEIIALFFDFILPKNYAENIYNNFMIGLVGKESPLFNKPQNSLFWNDSKKLTESHSSTEDKIEEKQVVLSLSNYSNLSKSDLITALDNLHFSGIYKLDLSGTILNMEQFMCFYHRGYQNFKNVILSSGASDTISFRNMNLCSVNFTGIKFKTASSGVPFVTLHGACLYGNQVSQLYSANVNNFAETTIVAGIISFSKIRKETNFIDALFEHISTITIDQRTNGDIDNGINLFGASLDGESFNAVYKAGRRDFSYVVFRDQLDFRNVIEPVNFEYSKWQQITVAELNVGQYLDFSNTKFEDVGSFRVLCHSPQFSNCKKECITLKDMKIGKEEAEIFYDSVSVRHFFNCKINFEDLNLTRLSSNVTRLALFEHFWNKYIEHLCKQSCNGKNVSENKIEIAKGLRQTAENLNINDKNAQEAFNNFKNEFHAKANILKPSLFDEICKGLSAIPHFFGRDYFWQETSPEKLITNNLMSETETILGFNAGVNAGV